MVGWHHRLNGHEFEQIAGDNEGQGSLACCSPWGHKESDMTEQLNSSKFQYAALVLNIFSVTLRRYVWIFVGGHESFEFFMILFQSSAAYLCFI